MKSRWIMIGLLGAGLLGAPAFGANPAHPGTLNYVEGAAFLEGRQLNTKDVGSVELDAGEVLSTGVGKAEVLLTPGIFLRLDDQSAVKMISPDLTMTQVELVKGRAAIEVDEIYPQNHIQVVDGGVVTQMEKPGYYEFNANNPTAMVFKGKAEVEVGENKYAQVKDHHELVLATVTDQKPGTKIKAADFYSKATQDELYNWSSLRSQDGSEANNGIAWE